MAPGCSVHVPFHPPAKEAFPIWRNTDWCKRVEVIRRAAEIIRQSPEGIDPYAQWLASLADRQARARVLVRVLRMAAGNFGDCKSLSDGVWELRIDHGPGYRVYYAQAGKRLILLLAGGDKRKQQADIETAIERWNDWQHRRKPT
jgi:putative addiction module killer protein